MNYRYQFFLLIIGVIFFSSCTITGRSTSEIPMNAQLNFSMNDLEYMGDVKGTSTQSYVLGIPIGGRRRYYGHVGIAGPNLNRFQFSNRGYNNALYDALNSKPDADFVLPIAVNYDVNRMFLGKRVTLNIRAKAFKFKEISADSTRKE